jgi:predicted protein tyrosine phosphatase
LVVEQLDTKPIAKIINNIFTVYKYSNIKKIKLRELIPMLISKNKDGQQPIVKVWSRSIFEKQDISHQFQFAISIQEFDQSPEIVRPDYKGQRLNLYFFDTNVEEGWGYPTKEDIDELYVFSEKWVKEAKKDVFSARLVVHCLAGISRSSACAMMPLTLFYEGDYQKASEHLFDHFPYVMPNTLILKLIKEKLGLNPKESR